jgi:hypothetical protein
MKSSSVQDFESQLGFTLKEVEKLKEENLRLRKYIEDREK